MLIQASPSIPAGWIQVSKAATKMRVAAVVLRQRHEVVLTLASPVK